MNINAPIMDMSMNPNGYHQTYIQQNMMPPQSQQQPQHGSQHHEAPSNMSVAAQQQPPPAHPSQSQSQSSSGGNSSQGGSSSDGGASGLPGFQVEIKQEAGIGPPGKKKTWPKKKVYKKPDPNAPKQRRFSGYYVYMRERRDQLRSMYPEMPFYEIIRQLAQEWNNMDRETKQKYLDSAEIDKQSYEREMSAFKKTDGAGDDITFKSSPKKRKKNQVNHSGLSGGGGGGGGGGPSQQQSPLDMNISSANSSFGVGSTHTVVTIGNLPGSSGMSMLHRASSATTHMNHDNTGMEIPIFTEEFLRHSSDRELELRALRKTVAECEEQNATLQKHVEQMQAEIERMEHEMRQQKIQNEMLSQNLNRLRSVLAQSFASLPLPGSHEPPNIHTIDKYMNEVKAMQEANSVHFAPFLNRVKDIISRLEL